jgi:hypothetical protein
MKSEKEKLAAKTVDQLKAAAKRLGGKLVTPDGKAKTKVQLINTIVMKQRLAGKSTGAKAKTTKKVVAKKTATKKTSRRLLSGRTKADYVQDFANTALSRYQNNPKKSFDTIFDEMVKSFSNLGVKSAYERVGELNFFNWRNAKPLPKDIQEVVVLAFEDIYPRVKVLFESNKKYYTK